MSTCNPQVQISYSDDGGYTWSRPRYVALGKIGATNQLVRAWRLGSSRNRLYKIVYKEATPFALFGADLNLTITPGPS